MIRLETGARHTWRRLREGEEDKSRQRNSDKER